MLSPPYKITSTHLLLIHHLPVMHIFEDSNLKSPTYNKEYRSSQKASMGDLHMYHKTHKYGKKVNGKM
jgi:hypothetical protein